MKTMKRLIIVIAILFAMPARAGLDQVPGVISAPVVLYDEGSNLLSDGEYSVIVAFKDAFDATLFSEEQLVQVRNGVALISIGNGYAVGSEFSTASGGLNASTFDVGTDVAVEILVEGQSLPQELTVLGSQPYSFIAQKAMSVADETITSSQIKNGSVHEEDLDEALLEELRSSSPILVQDDSGEYQAIDLNASQVEVDADIGLNNASGTSLDAVLRDLDTAIDTLRGTDLDQSVDAVNDSIDTVNSTIESHSDAVSGVHGVTGDIVGTSDTQSLQNKTIDSTNNIVGEAITSGSISDSRIPVLVEHLGASTDIHGVAGSVVGTTDTQSLQNKTFDSTNNIVGEAITSGSISGSRIPSLVEHTEATSGVHGIVGSVVGTTNTQTLQNKTVDSTNSVTGDAINSGTVADARIASTITRDSELTFSNLSGTLATAQFPDSLGKNITFDDASCSGGTCKIDGVDVSSLNGEVTSISSNVSTINGQVTTMSSDISSLDANVSSISDQIDDDIDDSRISPYIRPLAYGYIAGESGCSSMDLVSGYNVESVTSGSETARIRLSQSLAQDSDLIIMVEEVSDPSSQPDLDHDCLRGYGYYPNASAGTNSFYVAHCSSSSDCSSISEKKFTFVVYQIPR